MKKLGRSVGEPNPTSTTHPASAGTVAASFGPSWKLFPLADVFVWMATVRFVMGFWASTSVPGAFLIVTVANQPRRESSAAT